MTDAPTAQIPRARPGVPRRRAWLPYALLLLAGLVVYLPALRAPFLLDDYQQAAMIDGSFPVRRSPFDLYNFVNDTDRRSFIDRGMLPWWSDPHLQIRFFRPLSSALLWADHTLFGNRPLPLHLHSLLWWLGAALGARALYLRLLARRAAMIATFVFALAPCHALPLSWLANREALVSLTLGTLALGAYLRFREGRRLRDGALATALFAAAMLGGEYALCMGGYVLAIEAGARGERLLARALGLAPFALPAAGYLYVHRALGYGSVGSGPYTDPFNDTAAFARSALRRLVMLALDGWFSLDHDTLSSRTPWWALALAVATAAALFLAPFRRAVGRLDEAQRRAVAWLLPGSILAMIPVLAVVPSPRLLGASMLGIAALVGLLLDHAWFVAATDERPGAAEQTSLAALALGFAHLVHAPVTSWLVGRYFQRTGAVFSAHAAELRARLPDPTSAEIVVVRAAGGAFFLPFALGEHTGPPARWRALVQTGHALTLRRDARTLEVIVPREQGAFPSGPDNLFRTVRTPLAVGEVHDLPGMRVTILELGAQGPQRVRFELDRDIGSEPQVWITEELTGFNDAAPPAVGFGKPFDP